MSQFDGLVSMSVALNITMAGIHIYDMFFLVRMALMLYFSYNVGWFPLVLEASKTGKVVKVL